MLANFRDLNLDVLAAGRQGRQDGRKTGSAAG